MPAEGRHRGRAGFRGVRAGAGGAAAGRRAGCRASGRRRCGRAGPGFERWALVVLSRQVKSLAAARLCWAPAGGGGRHCTVRPTQPRGIVACRYAINRILPQLMLAPGRGSCAVPRPRSRLMPKGCPKGAALSLLQPWLCPMQPGSRSCRRSRQGAPSVSAARVEAKRGWLSTIAEHDALPRSWTSLWGCRSQPAALERDRGASLV